MKEKFNNEHTPKSSGNCDKYSKSVSYETLVGGTATTGTGYKQIRRLSKCSANKPLTAVGTLTSLLCNSAKVVEKWLQISPLLKLVKVLGLVAVLSVGIIGESWGEEIPAGGVSGTCNTDGTCLWTLDKNGKMIISAVASEKGIKIGDYVSSSRPWEAYIGQIKTLEVGNNITYIGSMAFQGATSLRNITGMNDVQIIRQHGFYGCSELQSVETPYVKLVGDRAFQGTNLSSIDLPNVEQINFNAFTNVKNLMYVGLPRAENLTISDSAFYYSNLRGCSNENRVACGSCGNGYVMSGLGCVSDCGEGYLGKEGRCIDSVLGCGDWYRQFENFCNRIRWTPAEAAKVLRDDNTNEVTITFKK